MGHHGGGGTRALAGHDPNESHQREAPTSMATAQSREQSNRRRFRARKPPNTRSPKRLTTTRHLMRGPHRGRTPAPPHAADRQAMAPNRQPAPVELHTVACLEPSPQFVGWHARHAHLLIEELNRINGRYRRCVRSLLDDGVAPRPTDIALDRLASCQREAHLAQRNAFPQLLLEASRAQDYVIAQARSHLPTVAALALRERD
eukprot:CAMPEP_0176088120 /NCGR_PEP_ID=MMETSP0120_2-20121206/44121_1 /TAXON_ID=160619 /ORGANISM="Kryptoperidinium foliaceum, Strain CCMP 1326" /LENGTH=202 /DNA_ID=CAMNT_0017421975 /DNA_START=368 /DNA_END=977 /DNA_ORIENTATION=-